MKIRDGFESFRERVLPGHRDHFAQLAGGQAPEVLFLTCSDSRIDPAMITQSVPGELFIIRNAGNFVDVREGSGEAATIEYGVRALGVKHIVVCGHSHCGAVTAALDPESASGLPAVSAWLRGAGPDLSEFESAAEGADRVLEAVGENVAQQLARLRSMSFVAEAEREGALELHGWIYRFEHGEIHELDEAAGVWRPLEGALTVAESRAGGGES